MKKAFLALLVSVALLTSTGCYGKFGLVRKVYGWNGHVTGNKIVNSIVMWGLFIIPVYEVCSLADLIVLNPIEVVTGSNPVGD